MYGLPLILNIWKIIVTYMPIQSDPALLADIFENFWNIYMSKSLDQAHFYSVPGLAWIAAVKISEKRIEVITNNVILLTIEWWIRGGRCHLFLCHAKNYNENKDSWYLRYLGENNFRECYCLKITCRWVWIDGSYWFHHRVLSKVMVKIVMLDTCFSSWEDDCKQ